MQTQYLASFGRQRGRRIRDGKKQLMSTLLPVVQIPQATLDQAISHEKIQGLFLEPEKEKPIYLEIGFGTGVHLANQARMHPDAGLIGCEPYIHGWGDLLREIDEGQLSNIRIFADDARLFLDKLPDHSPG